MSSGNSSSNRNGKGTQRSSTASARTSKTKFYFRITINAFVGSMLAAIATCLIFKSGQDITPIVITVIGVFCVCIGAVSVVSYFRHDKSERDTAQLIVGVIQLLIGVILIVMANTVVQWVYIAIGVALMLYGAFHIFKAIRSGRKGNMFGIIMGILLVIIGLLVLFYAFGWEWMNTWGYILVGIAAYIGAVIFLFF